jgi:hypothetical protein
MKITKTFTLMMVFGISLFLMTGCITKQTYTETDVVGIEAESPNVAGLGTALSVRIGIIHSRLFSNPTSTNQVYSAPFKYGVQANLGILSQTVTNSLDTK